MPSRVDGLIDHIAKLERELETELTRARSEWRYEIEALIEKLNCVNCGYANGVFAYVREGIPATADPAAA